ncbi:uncharacterized protein [Periplaneta americana]|uniref:uncharacterized protein n=1 Tax=Periplaneta americana TaxID=6978 RepID=UPI0037E79278
MKALYVVAVFLAVLAATGASSLREDAISPASLDVGEDVLKSVGVEGEVEQLQRHPRSAGRLIKYLIMLMKRGGPNVRKKVMELAKPLAKNGITLKYHKNSKFKSKLHAARKRDKIIASKDQNRPPSTILDILDSLGVFDFILGAFDDEEDEAPAPRRRPAGRRSK